MSTYLNGHIYHMVHIGNLCSIFKQQSLLPKNTLKLRGIDHSSIANEAVQHLRDRIRVQVPLDKQSYNLHSYVPFYFTPSTPMFSAVRSKVIIEQIVFLEVSRQIMNNKGVIFTDGNASCQQLSKKGKEIVLIIPASSHSPCVRQYIPDGPHGTSESVSNFYSDIACLKKLNWRSIYGGYTGNGPDERRRVRCAEVLIPNAVPTSLIKCIGVQNTEIAQKVKSLFAQNNLKAAIPLLTIHPDFYS